MNYRQKINEAGGYISIGACIKKSYYHKACNFKVQKVLPDWLERSSHLYHFSPNDAAHTWNKDVRGIKELLQVKFPPSKEEKHSKTVREPGDPSFFVLLCQVYMFLSSNIVWDVRDHLEKLVYNYNNYHNSLLLLGWLRNERFFDLVLTSLCHTI